jgi:hypothetical protein
VLFLAFYSDFREGTVVANACINPSHELVNVGIFLGGEDELHCQKVCGCCRILVSSRKHF